MSTHAVAIMTVGALFVLLGMYATHYHARAFQAHIDALEMAAVADDDARIAAEVRRFNENVWLDRAARLMMVEPIGWLLVIVGVAFAIF